MPGGSLTIWRQHSGSLWRRLGFTGYASLELIFTGLLHQWKLLGLDSPVADGNGAAAEVNGTRRQRGLVAGHA